MAALRHAVRHGTDAELTAALEAWSLPDAAELVLEALELLLRLASSTSGHRASAALVAYDLVLPQLELAELAAPHLNPAERERLRKLRRWARRVADPAQAARDTRLGLVVFALLALGALAVVYGIGRLLLAWIEVRAAA
jgi:hypothetical protein